MLIYFDSFNPKCHILPSLQLSNRYDSTNLDTHNGNVNQDLLLREVRMWPMIILKLPRAEEVDFYNFELVFIFESIVLLNFKI